MTEQSDGIGVALPPPLPTFQKDASDQGPAEKWDNRSATGNQWLASGLVPPGVRPAALDHSLRILRGAIEIHEPDYIVSMVSGGKDSAASHAVAVELGVKIDLVIHGNTRCGIPQTSQFVEATYGNGPWDYAVADAGTAYEDYVLRKSFFGVGISAHAYAYRVLKATPFRKVISSKLRQRKRAVWWSRLTTIPQLSGTLRHA